MSTMETESPIKAFIRKHSPIKSRNKPLPGPPVDDGSPSKSRARVPGRVVSGNVSPTKATAADAAAPKATKRKISALWKHSQTEDEPRPQNSKHRRVVSSPVRHEARRSSAHSIDPLSDHISTLEAQLRAAKAELAGTSSVASQTVKQASPFKSRPHAARRTQSYQSHADIDRSVEQRQRSLQRGGYYDGVVESLLQPDYTSACRSAASRSTRGLESPTRRSASATGHYARAVADYKDLEDSYTEYHTADDLELARRRSEMRAAEWRRVQEHVASQRKQQAGSKRTHDDGNMGASERPARRQKSIRAMPCDKALPDLPQRPGRAMSEGHVRQVVTEKEARAVSPETARAHTIQYVQARPHTPQDTAEPALPAREEDNNNVTVFCDDEDEDYAPPTSPLRRNMASPSRLDTVDEEFEWNDEEIF